MGPGEWLAVLRIALGLWWLESFRHKDKRAWIEDGSGIKWAASVAAKHRWGIVRRAFEATAGRAPKAFTWVILGAELALGLGLTIGFLTPVALFFSALLAATYFVLMIHDWAEQGQTSMMFAISVCLLGAKGWSVWSADAALGWFGAYGGGWFAYAPGNQVTFSGLERGSWGPPMMLAGIASLWAIAGIRKGYDTKPESDPPADL